MAQPAFDHWREGRDEGEGAGQRLVASAQEAVHRTGASVRRAGAYVQSGLAGVADRAQHLAEGANDRIEHLTGRPIEAWPGHARRLVREHPLQALAATVGLGYVLGRLLLRRR
jgi:ElaB/YqjD/DUF883 family membrane-anchored ribosome-binding protein